MGESIARRWRALSGENKWVGLLQPLDSDLRRYIIHYCQMAGAMGDLFNRGTGKPDASEEEFLSKACLVKGNPFEYEVTRFIDAGSTLVPPSCFGYVAVATDEGKHALGRRDILVSWRGTDAFMEWINNINIEKRPASGLFPAIAGKDDDIVHGGFHSLYTGIGSDTSARQQILKAVSELLNKHKDEEISITVTGHSLGGALAVLTAMDIVANGHNKIMSASGGNKGKRCMVTVFTFGSPRIGNAKLRTVFATLGVHLHLLRVVNKKDYVPNTPHGVFSYVNFGQKLAVDTSVSNYLERRKGFSFIKCIGVGSKRSRRVYPSDEEDSEAKRRRTNTGQLNKSKGKNSFIETVWRGSHNMDMYAHGVAIKGIEEDTDKDDLVHDIALVNKHLDQLKREHGIPENWWVGKNREKMVQDPDSGRWEVVRKGKLHATNQAH